MKMIRQTSWRTRLMEWAMGLCGAQPILVDVCEEDGVVVGSARVMFVTEEDDNGVYLIPVSNKIVFRYTGRVLPSYVMVYHVKKPEPEPIAIEQSMWMAKGDTFAITSRISLS